MRQTRGRSQHPRNRHAADWQTDDDTFFDPERYRRRTVVEHASAGPDGFKTLLVRYKTSVGNWLAWHWLAFVILFFCEKSTAARLSKQPH